MNDIAKARRIKETTDKYKLDNVDSLLLKHLCLHPSISLRELGDLVGMSKTAVRKRINKPEFKRQLQENQGTTLDSINRLVHLSCARLKTILEGDDPKLVIEAAKLAFNMYTTIAPKQETAQSIVYSVRFGEQGQMFREIRQDETDENVYPTTLDLMNN